MGSLSVNVVDLEIVFNPFGVHYAALYAHSTFDRAPEAGTTTGSFFTVTLPRPVLSKRLPWRRTASATPYFAMSSVTGVGLDPIAAKACAILSPGLPRFFLTVPAGPSPPPVARQLVAPERDRARAGR